MKYWTYYWNKKTGFSQVIEATDTNTFIDRLRKATGRVFKSDRDAKTALAIARGK